jgi:uncharacterized protein YicC (UPF0701 family)
MEDNRNAQATKGDLEDLRQATKGDLEELRQEIKQEGSQLRTDMQHQYDDLKETMRDVQTEILKAFYGYTQTTDAKLNEGEVADAAIRQRVTILESRLLEVEKRLNMPPQQ